MSENLPLATPVDADFLTLASDATDGKVAVCAGAGISLASGLPSGRQLAEKLNQRFDGTVAGYACADATSLIAVADAGAALPGGLQAVQRTVLDLAPFSTAPPTFAHQLLALLVTENAIRLLLTNWDDCVERAMPDTRLPAARREEEAEALRGQFVLKIHGCCTQPDTLLITSGQLETPGLWTAAHFPAHLATSNLVFLGIGDVADYAQRRITELAELVGDNRVRVVSPTIDADWDASRWSAILPALAAHRRIAMTADEFLDQLARAWLIRVLQRLHDAATESTSRAVADLCDAFKRFNALQALLWIRRAAHGWAIGTSVATDPALQTALEAIAVLSSQQTPTELSFIPASAVLLNGRRLEVLLCQPRSLTSAVEEAAIERARVVAPRIHPRPDEISVLCSAAFLRGPRNTVLTATDIVDPYASVDDVIDGPRAVTVRLSYADSIMEAA